MRKLFCILALVIILTGCKSVDKNELGDIYFGFSKECVVDIFKNHEMEVSEYDNVVYAHATKDPKLFFDVLDVPVQSIVCVFNSGGLYLVNCMFYTWVDEKDVEVLKEKVEDICGSQDNDDNETMIFGKGEQYTSVITRQYNADNELCWSMYLERKYEN